MVFWWRIKFECRSLFVDLHSRGKAHIILCNVNKYCIMLNCATFDPYIMYKFLFKLQVFSMFFVGTFFLPNSSYCFHGRTFLLCRLMIHTCTCISVYILLGFWLLIINAYDLVVKLKDYSFSFKFLLKHQSWNSHV